MASNDWNLAMEALFNITKPKKILEFGLGEGTKLLSRNSESLLSIELLVFPEHVGWFDRVGRFGLNNWRGELFATNDEFDEATEKYVREVINRTKYDLIFVDPGTHRRPEIINMCFGECPIIVTHDTLVGMDEYKWNRLKEPKKYYRVDYKYGEGTTFWLTDEKLAKKLKDKFAVLLKSR